MDHASTLRYYTENLQLILPNTSEDSLRQHNLLLDAHTV